MAEQLKMGDTTEQETQETAIPAPETTSLTERIKEKIDSTYETDYRVSPINSNRASALGHDCERYLVLMRLHWKKQKMPSLGTLRLFALGNLFENIVVDLLNKTSIRVQKAQMGLEWKEYNITGSIDGVIFTDGKELPLEIKSVSPFYFNDLKSFQDIKTHRYWFVRKWAAQMQLYLLMQNLPEGIMLLINKTSGEITPIEVDLDYDFAESLVAKAERIEKHLKDGTVPEPIKWDEDICGRCDWYGTLCVPDMEREGVEIMDDPELEAELDRREFLKPLRDEYEKLWKMVKVKIANKSGFCGSYEIGGKITNVKGNPNPKPKEPYSYWSPKIRRLPDGADATPETKAVEAPPDKEPELEKYNHLFEGK